MNTHTTTPWRIGFIPLLDCAPLAAASTLGFFKDHQINAALIRQPGWACIRDKLLFKELDAANAPGGLLMHLNAEAKTKEQLCLSAFLFNLQGNAITLSQRLHDRGISDLQDFRTEALARSRQNPLTLAVVSRHSSHYHLLRQWLVKASLSPDRDIRIAVLPPQQMIRNLEIGNLDGFCAGDPWNTLASEQKVGWTRAHSGDLAPKHPEQALILRSTFASERHEEHLQMIRALTQATQWCHDPINHSALAELLSAPEWINLPAPLILTALTRSQATIFSGHGVNEPTIQRASWIVNEMDKHGALKISPTEKTKLLQSFRPDIYREALGE